jgi:bifunctional non-homologous end joining protein LigD
MLATPAESLPAGPEWTYEVKWDGYRVVAVKDARGVKLLSRNQKDLTRDFPAAAAAVTQLPVADAALDGEIVALDGAGRPSFQALQHRALAGLTIVYYAFDLLRVNSADLLAEPLEERRRRLAAVTDGSRVLLSDALPGSVDRIEREVRRLGLEGIVAKKRGSRYRPGQRTKDWLKVKFSPRQEFVVGGYRPGGDTFDSILVGYYRGRDLLFASKVRAGFTPHTRAELFRRIAGREIRRCPFDNLPNAETRGRWGEGITAEDMGTLRWVKPALVVEVSFVEWTNGGMLRHASYVGVRDDKRASTVTRLA